MVPGPVSEDVEVTSVEGLTVWIRRRLKLKAHRKDCGEAGQHCTTALCGWEGFAGEPGECSENDKIHRHLRVDGGRNDCDEGSEQEFAAENADQSNDREGSRERARGQVGVHQQQAGVGGGHGEDGGED